MDPKLAKAKRHILSFTADDPIVVDGVEVTVLRVLGQSFLLHQIRKMVAVAVEVVNGGAPESVFDTVFEHNKVDLPLVPGTGLYMNRCGWDVYNKKVRRWAVCRCGCGACNRQAEGGRRIAEGGRRQAEAVRSARRGLAVLFRVAVRVSRSASAAAVLGGGGAELWLRPGGVAVSVCSLCCSLPTPNSRFRVLARLMLARPLWLPFGSPSASPRVGVLPAPCSLLPVPRPPPSLPAPFPVRARPCED
jgi:hypothetical protein